MTEDELLDAKLDILVRLHHALRSLQEAEQNAREAALAEPGALRINDDLLLTNIRQAREMLMRTVRRLGTELHLTDFVTYEVTHEITEAITPPERQRLSSAPDQTGT